MTLPRLCGALLALMIGLNASAGDFLTPDLYPGFLSATTRFLSDHFRWPSEAEANDMLESLKTQMIRKAPKEFREELAAELHLQDVHSVLAESRAGIMNDFRTQNFEGYLKLRRKLATAYSRAIRQTDLEVRYRTVAQTPSMNLFFLSTIKPKSNGGPTLLKDYGQGRFDREHLEDLVIPGRSPHSGDGLFPPPLIFQDGVAELQKATRFDAPFAFRNYVDKDVVNKERGQKTLRAIEQAKGFVAVSWTTGKPLNRDYLDSLLAMLEERDWVMVVCPTLQNFEGLPPELLNNPRIHLLTNTIENRYLKLWNLPINPNIENPIALAKKAGNYVPGQTVIVFHPHQMMQTIATTTNEYLPVQIWATGSLNEPFGPFSAASQGAGNQSKKGFHKTKFLAIEKGDGASRFESDSLENVWHVRPVTFYDDTAPGRNNTAGIVDFFRTYQFTYAKDGTRTFHKFDQDPKYFYLGDLHDRITDPRFAKGLIDLGLKHDTQVTFITGDLFDGNSINHWISKNKIAMNKQHQAGGNNLQEELNKVISSVNALMQRYPNARFAQIVGNHDEWLNRLLADAPDVQDIINGDLIDELNFVVKVLRMNVWEYIFKQREQVLTQILGAFPDKRREIISRVLPVYDSSRVDILDRDQNLFAGPEWRRNALNYHGDKGSGPKGGAFKAHAQAMPEGGGFTGHTHKTGIFSEVIDVGVGAELVQDYTVGGYGSQGQGVGVMYENGTKQLLQFNRISGTFHQTLAKLVPPANKFFGHDRLAMLENDNDLVNKAEGEGLIQNELERLRELAGPACERYLSTAEPDDSED